MDRYGRSVNGLRVSVTEACNFNCFYCHREGCPESSREMSSEEVGCIIEIAAGFGVEKVKITGGEPLLRRDIVDIVAASVKPGIKEVSMTTNGALLSEKAQELAEAGLNRVNISLDTLDAEKFARITHNGSLGKVLDGIDAALEAKLVPIKLNMVLLKGINEDEVDRMIDFAGKRGMILQLIELVDLNGADFREHHLALEEIERSLAARATVVRTRRLMQSRKRYLLPNGEVEVVRPMHNTKFCAHCHRLRLTPDGYLKPCLMRNDNLVDILSHVREGDLNGARRAFVEAVRRREPFFKRTERERCPHAL
ncbi:MAG: GTP 3',8-cyclase MoaA [Candidatus Hadarchaeum sp.]|uniref:GTP 3',8-cyclase MoaA n=1 Tax=Candidatus Hadarchaeum sp. TaxID=2883567 RepID=UPI003D0A080C